MTVEAMCISSGDRLPQSVIDKWFNQTGQLIHNCLGTTECLTSFCFNFHGTTGIGEAIPGYEIRVVDEHGNLLQSGVGRLQINAPSMGIGYWRDPEWTSKAFASWMTTGDMVWCDSNGQYHHVGRVGDIIKISGQFVNPGELEETLTQYPGVEQAAVVSRATETGIEQIEAYVVPVPHRTLDELVLKQWMNRYHERHACPRKIHVVSELPRTETGKIQRFRLRQAC
jgi:acyl-coenzyme A synthetase/AMP-(fatty) acid ligase